MLVQKNKKETEKELAHIDLYFDGTFIGYIIKNNSSLASKNENWNFCSKHNKLPFCFDKTKALLIDKVTKLCYENNI